MITFIQLATTRKVLKIINDCIEKIIEYEIYYYELCKNEDKIIPKSFVKINRNKGINVNLLESTKGERLTIFTDIFAVTMLKNTPLESSAPFLLQDEMNKVFEEYFTTEIMKKIEDMEGQYKGYK